MKQHLTLADARSLPDKSFENLFKWVFNVHQREAEDANPGSFVSVATPELHDLCLSVGQLIQFLDEHDTFYSVEHKKFDFQKKDGLVKPFWRVSFGERLYEEDELCDALFKAAKTALE